MRSSAVALVAPVRSGIGREGGSLAALPPDLLASAVVGEVVRRSGVDPARVGDVILGNQFGGSRVARNAALLAGLPESVPGLVVNRLCASALQAVALAAQAVRLGEADYVVAGGVESYSQAPFLMERPRRAYQREVPRFLSGTGASRDVGDPSLGLGMSMGLTAERVAEVCGVSREDQDAFACESQRRAAAAAAQSLAEPWLLPVAMRPDGTGPLFAADECVRPDTTPEALRSLPPLFRRDGTVTAGNTSKRSDAAAAVLVTSEEGARSLATPVAGWYVDAAVVGVHPTVMGIGPVPATQRLLARERLQMGDVDLVELNEAFAAQAVAVIRELGADPERVNVLGGAIAHGHPSGATGAVLTIKLLGELARRSLSRGLVTLCIGGGMGIAALFERA